MIELPKRQAVEDWIEGEPIGRLLCPPLVGVASRYRKADGSLDWNGLGTEVKIEDMSHFDPRSIGFLAHSFDRYLDFIFRSVSDPNAPLTQLVICPDFGTNKLFNQFIAELKRITINGLQSEQAQKITQYIADQVLQARDTFDLQDFEYILSGPEGIASFLVNSAYIPLQFYGRKIDDEDLIGLSETRGPKRREKKLKRAPYDLYQVINEIKVRQLIAGRDLQITYDRNTRTLDSIPDEEYEEIIAEYRRAR